MENKNAVAALERRLVIEIFAYPIGSTKSSASELKLRSKKTPHYVEDNDTHGD